MGVKCHKPSFPSKTKIDLLTTELMFLFGKKSKKPAKTKFISSNEHYDDELVSSERQINAKG